ncbi:Ni/Co efflux regulator RcnB [Pseudorhizobium tarimense]|uniref:Ni/Co efflux regulator RcnB n=1 Tax=Pseudorhizobium tarimense TaxID=1079109 RepID=A0ABV2H347_9HYPH|nr:RcnB family protein [Pseudorhizobium tarimense]MCJ8518065.1 RcnB family protein [Pseudorhizobium tarimense]
MKKLVTLMLAATVLAAPMAQARDDHRQPDRSRHVAVEKKVVVKKHRWSRGHRLSAAERRHMRDVRDYHRYRLSAPPRGYRWVQVDNDFLLIGITSGIISSIIAAR